MAETYHPRGQLVHGFRVRQHPLYHTWADMKRRCNNPSDESYENYGGRGITYCSRWKDFANFAEDMWPKPYPEATLERKNNSQGYSPSNCKWAGRSEQCHNRRAFKNNSSGEQGVVSVNGGRFEARFDDHGVRFLLGRFTTQVEASNFRAEFIKRYRLRTDNWSEMLERRARYDSSTGIRGITRGKSGYIARRTIAGTRTYLGHSTTLRGAVALLGGVR